MRIHRELLTTVAAAIQPIIDEVAVRQPDLFTDPSWEPTYELKFNLTVRELRNLNELHHLLRRLDEK